MLNLFCYIMSNSRTLKLVSLTQLGVPQENLRKHNTDLELDDLATNILALGQSQPLLVFESSDEPDTYEVIDGQRRLNAFDLLNQKHPGKGFDKIYVMIRDAPKDSNMRKAISLGANITQLEMTSDDIQKGVIDLYLTHSNMKLVAEEFGITEKTAKKYVKSARLNPRLRKAQLSGEIDSDPEVALDCLMEAVDLVNWTESNDVDDEKAIKAAQILARTKTKDEAEAFKEEISKDPDQDMDEVAKKVKDGIITHITRKVILPPETDKDLVTYAKLCEVKKKPEEAAAIILIQALQKLVSQEDD